MQHENSTRPRRQWGRAAIADPPVVDLLVSRLDGVRGNGSGWTAQCPAHDDRKNSLSISETDGKVLIYCHAGCKTADVLKAVGLTWRDLFSGNGHSTETPPTKLQRPALDPLTWWADYCHVPTDFLKTLPIQTDGDNVVFCFPNGVKKLRRTGTKDISWHPPGSPTPALWPMPGPELPETIWLCEGESDATVARYLGCDAFALTHGAGTPLTPDQAAELKRRGASRAIICLDADPPGREGAKKLAAVLQAAGIEAVTVDLVGQRLLDPLLAEKDLRDFWLATPDRDIASEMLGLAAREAAKTAINGRVPNLQPHLQPIGGPVGGEVCAAELKARPHQAIEYLPFLGRSGYIPKGWCILVAAYPKTGKTELLARLCAEWATEGECILYITEEPTVIWQHRLAKLRGTWERVRLLFGLGVEPGAILERIREGQETIVVVDTVRSLLGLEDETDNSEVARALGAYVAAARENGKTLILLHHTRKGGGEHGEGITGGHAFLGVVDIALEIQREPNLGDRRRRVRGWGRLMPIDELVYSLEEDGTMVALGSPRAVELDSVKERVAEVLDGEWAKTREVHEQLDEPRPSLEQVRLALNGLVADGVAERDPANDKPGATYKYRLKQHQPNLQRPPYMVGGKVLAPAPPNGHDRNASPVATGPPTVGDADRLLDLAQAAGWPSVPIGRGESVCAGEAKWRVFATYASPQDIRAAIAALEKAEVRL